MSGGDQGEESSLVVGDLDVDSLEDEELFNLLKVRRQPNYSKQLFYLIIGPVCENEISFSEFIYVLYYYMIIYFFIIN